MSTGYFQEPGIMGEALVFVSEIWMKVWRHLIVGPFYSDKMSGLAGEMR